MRVAHIGNVQRMANGVGQVISNLSIAQRKAGHEVLVLTARKKEDPLEMFTEVHEKKMFEKLMHDFKPDIFIFHSLYIWEYIKFYPILIKLSIPFLIQLHGAMSVENYKKNHLKKLIANELFYKKLIKKASGIIYLNQQEYENSLVKYINSESAIIPNGCDVVERNSHINAEDTNNERIRIVYVGRFDIYHKGLDVLIEALRKLQDQKEYGYISVEFYGTDEESQIERFKNLIKPLNRIATYHGPIYGVDKHNLLRNSGIFILTSRYEGMPMGILEALAYGLPCLVTPQTNMAEIIEEGKCGWVSELDSDQIAKTILEAVKDYKKEKDLLISNSLSAASFFNWDNIADMTINLYKRILGDVTNNR